MTRPARRRSVALAWRGTSAVGALALGTVPMQAQGGLGTGPHGAHRWGRSPDLGHDSRR